MAAHDWILPARAPLCLPADSLYRTGQAIFHNLSGTVTPDMINAAQEALAQYRTELAATLHPLHFGVSVGRHICVEDVYCEAKARLRGLAATIQPAPEPPPPPARKSPHRSADEVVNDIMSLSDEIKQPGNIYLGEERRDDAAPGGGR
jgi:alkanesulfonate monooxygenase SsuD/methylene tetrahydromethanopterin reductase-like flavin-dependent oxidoreductase (luciferase family)